MSQYNNKGMASDLSLGRPTTATGGNDPSDIAAAAARHANFFMQHARSEHREVVRDDAEFDQSRLIGGLECYVQALQGEREKLDAFRRELPICMGLLDDAIQASREKLTKAVASSRMVACQASYSNYGGPNVNTKGGGVHSTSPGEQDGSLYSWGLAGSKPHAHAHAAHDDDQLRFEKHQPPTSNLKETQHHMHPSHHSMPLLPHLATTTPNHLHFVNYPPPHTPSNHTFLNKFPQKESTLFNQDSEMMQMRQQCRKPEGFHSTLEFSSSKNNDHEEQMIMAREGVNQYEGPLPVHEHNMGRDREESASPTLMMNSISNNSNMNSGGAAGAGIMSCTGQTPRKARRCWSPELHQRFLHALHQLGGPQSATPKQIREVMHVEGLTNDEVKSHLQKFRLHTRRPAPIQTSEPAQQPHHLVLFGGIWVPTSPAESTPAAQLAACQLAAGGHATSSGNHNPYVPFQHVIGQNPMQALMRAASGDGQLDMHAGLETASEVDVARSDQSTSQNGGLENNMHEDEDTEIHLGSKPIISREITSPIAKARYQ